MHICKQVTVPILQQLRKEVADAEAAISNSKPKSVPLPIQIGSTRLPLLEVQMPSQREERGNQGLTKAFFVNVAKLLMLSLEECSIQEVWNLIHSKNLSVNLIQNILLIAMLFSCLCNLQVFLSI